MFIYLPLIRCLFDRFAMAAPPTNPFACMLDTNKLKGVEKFTDWGMDLRIVLNSEKL